MTDDRVHLRHHPARRRAVARHLAEHDREARDRPPARAAGRGHHRGRLPDRLARRLRGRAGDRPPGRGPGHRRPRPRSCRGHRRRLRRRYATRRDLGSTPSCRRRTSTSSTSCASTREDVKGQARAAVAHARALVDDVEFSPMDATRSDVEYTAEVVQIALDEGATTINIPDTVGYTMPERVHRLPRPALRPGAGLRDVVLSVHCHNDLGLAVANSLRGPAGRRPPGRVRDQRHRRARGQRGARGDRDAAAHPRAPTSASRPGSTRARSRARAASSRA